MVNQRTMLELLLEKMCDDMVGLYGAVNCEDDVQRISMHLLYHTLYYSKQLKTTSGSRLFFLET